MGAQYLSHCKRRPINCKFRLRHRLNCGNLKQLRRAGRLRVILLRNARSPERRPMGEPGRGGPAGRREFN